MSCGYVMQPTLMPHWQSRLIKCNHNTMTKHTCIIHSSYGGCPFILVKSCWYFIWPNLFNSGIWASQLSSFNRKQLNSFLLLTQFSTFNNRLSNFYSYGTIYFTNKWQNTNNFEISVSNCINVWRRPTNIIFWKKLILTKQYITYIDEKWYVHISRSRGTHL